MGQALVLVSIAENRGGVGGAGPSKDSSKARKLWTVCAEEMLKSSKFLITLRFCLSVSTGGYELPHRRFGLTKE